MLWRLFGGVPQGSAIAGMTAA
uniref:Uncharacterized protein n=1 Tax=Arundo donax TaxID=35708 RepID=A0A0A8YRH4_ARUDO